ncbi:MAG: DUF4102 domain-containing protein, partial [Alphaproteobacteria bacterium]|nr:DUF4102 domain-containing protein [Alphaproteobacteria bacterium]
MARTLHKLTPQRVKQKLKKSGTHGDGGGLYLSVKRAASKDQAAWASWLFRYASGWRESANGKRYPAGREMGLGDCESVSLATAREMAQRWRSVLKA